MSSLLTAQALTACLISSLVHLSDIELAFMFCMKIKQTSSCSGLTLNGFLLPKIDLSIAKGKNT